MSQLLTNATDRKECLIKEIKLDMDRIPDYLTKRNASFKQMMSQALVTTARASDLDHDPTIDELRKIAIVTRQIMLIQTYCLLWTAYLKSGMGQLITPSTKKPSYSTTVSVWPKEIKTMMATDSKASCLEFVNEHLHALDYQLKQCQADLNLKASQFPGYSLNIQKKIEAYIEQNLSSFRLRIDHQVQLLHYEYHIQALKLEYLQKNPNVYQVSLFKNGILFLN